MPKTKQKSVLWIEDDQQLVNLYMAMFRKIKDIRIEFMKLGQLALDRIKEIEEGKIGKPNLIMLDLLLPDISGDKILEQIRKTPSTKDIPVFVLTNYGSDGSKIKIMKELTAEKYLIKTEWVPTKLIALIQERVK